MLSNHDEISDQDLFVSPDGDDSWSGELSEPNKDGTDGPFATIPQAQQVIRERRDVADPLPKRVWLRGGRYEIEEPLRFGVDDAVPVTYAAYPDEKPVISGGRTIEGWEKTTVNDIDVWKTTVSAVANGEWYFRQLFVDGKRRQRPRLPKEGYYEVTDVPYENTNLWNNEGGISYSFTTEDAPLEEWHNLSDVDVLIPHRWVQERSPIETIDPTAGTVDMEFYAKMWLQGGERLAFENVFEGLSSSGDWYLDRETGDCYYVPMEDEEPETTEIHAPFPTQLLRIEGDPDSGKFVEFLGFKGITFRHAAWDYPAQLDSDLLQAPNHSLYLDDDAATSVQAQFVLPGAISFTGARNCSLEGCTIENIGLYGIQLAQGCKANRVIGNEVRDSGAGSIKLEGETIDGPRGGQNGNNRITDNHFHTGGQVFPAGVGILARHTFGNELVHNHIHDFYYSGISCGWSWGYGKCIDRDNHIDYNHIHDIGHGVLSDMGGVYTLGVQPGTTIRGNHIHDITCYDYGGWAIYPDEGTSHVVIENNLAHDTNRQVFHQHYGRENIIRNNIFALGEEGQINLSRVDTEEGQGFTFERNIVISQGSPLFLGGYGAVLNGDDLTTNLNLFWDLATDEPIFGQTSRDADAGERINREAWNSTGHDRHSIVADPEFTDVLNSDFGLSTDSPAFEVGFKSIDISSAGPRI